MNMKLSEEIKKQILDEFLKKVVRIADQNYQERVWVLAEGPECDDFDETACQFFDVGSPILENYKDFGISAAQYELLIKFRDIFTAFSRSESPNDLPGKFIHSPEWMRIVRMAREVLKAFNYRMERHDPSNWI